MLPGIVDTSGNLSFRATCHRRLVLIFRQSCCWILLISVAKLPTWNLDESCAISQLQPKAETERSSYSTCRAWGTIFELDVASNVSMNPTRVQESPHKTVFTIHVSSWGSLVASFRKYGSIYLNLIGSADESWSHHHQWKQPITVAINNSLLGHGAKASQKIWEIAIDLCSRRAWDTWDVDLGPGRWNWSGFLSLLRSISVLSCINMQ